MSTHEILVIKRNADGTVDPSPLTPHEAVDAILSVIEAVASPAPKRGKKGRAKS